MAKNQQNETKQQNSQAMQTTAGSNQTGSQQTGLAQRNQAWPSLTGGSPFTFMRRFSEEMDRLFEDFGFGHGWLTPSFGYDWPNSFGELDQSVWSPQVEVFEREGQLVVRADLPGLSKDDVKVEVTDDAIILQGERKQEHEEKREGYYHSECSYGSFYRSIPLPEGVNADDAQATFKNGVLEVTLKAPERAEQPHGRQLEIKGETENSGEAKAQSAKQGR